MSACGVPTSVSVLTPVATAVQSVISGSALKFFAPLTHSLVPTKGLRNYTFTRASAATVRDHEGRVHVCEANEARFEGARRVKNHCQSSEDITGTGWTSSGSPSVTKNTIRGDSYGDVALYNFTAESSVITVSVDLRLNANSPNVGRSQLLLYDITNAASLGSGPLITLSTNGDYVRHTYTWTNAIVGTDLRAYFYVGRSPDLLPVDMDINKVQIEQGVSIPSEYVSTDVGTGPELALPFTEWTLNDWSTAAGGLIGVNSTGNAVLNIGTMKIKDGVLYVIEFDATITSGSANWGLGGNFAGGVAAGKNRYVVTAGSSGTFIFNGITAFNGEISNFTLKEIDHGANVDGVKYFDTENGNTVDANNVVTEGVGAKLATVKGYLSEPQRTNLLINSGDVSLWAESQAVVVSTHDADGFQTVAPSDLSTVHYAAQNSSVTLGDELQMSFDAKPDGYDWIQVAISTGFNAALFVNFNVATGTVGNKHVNEADYTYSIKPNNDGSYRITVGSTATATSTSARFVLLPLPTDDINRAPTITGDNVSGVKIRAVNFEAGSFATSWMPTDAASQTRTASQLEAPNSVLPDKGSLVLDINMTSFPVSYAQRIFNCGSYAAGFYIETLPGGIFRFYRKNGAPPITYVQSTVTASAGVDHKVAISWDEATIRISVDGETPVEAVNAGTIDRTDNVDIGTAGFASGVERPACTIGDLKIYNKVYTGSKLQELST